LVRHRRADCDATRDADCDSDAPRARETATQWRTVVRNDGDKTPQACVDERGLVDG
jgi:hypothetical protein